MAAGRVAALSLKLELLGCGRKAHAPRQRCKIMALIIVQIYFNLRVKLGVGWSTERTVDTWKVTVCPHPPYRTTSSCGLFLE